MATLKPLVRPAARLSQPTRSQTRTFLSSFLPSAPSSEVQTLRASRTLPYPSAPIYSIIADVPSYSSFLPYCTRSTITHWSAPDAVTGRKWPSIGVLSSGFGNISEEFTSRVYCVPGRVVESVGGDTETRLPENEIRHHLDGEGGAVGRRGSEGLLTHLRNTWTVEEVGARQTRIELALEFRFANPMYAALSQGVAPKVAEAMVKAFEERVRSLLRDDPRMVDARLEELDGSRFKG